MPLFSKYRRPSGLVKRFARKRRSFKRLGAGLVRNTIPRRPTSTWSAPFLYAKNPMPAYEDVVLRYTWRTPMSTSSTAGLVGGGEIFLLNNCYDPRLGSASITTPGFTNMNTRYAQWVVTATMVDVSCDVPGATSEIFLNVMFLSSQNTTVLTGLATGNAQCHQDVGYNKLSSEGNRRCHVKKYIDIAGIEGIPKMALLCNSEYWGINSTPPNANPFIRVALSSASTTATSVEATVGVTLIFKVRFFNRYVSFNN